VKLVVGLDVVLAVLLEPISDILDSLDLLDLIISIGIVIKISL
jgi:hypothetical protein